MRWLMIAVTVVALALFGVGCGGGESAADTDTTAITETTGTDETTTDETTTDETSTDETTEDTDTTASGGGSLGDCLDAVAAFAALSQAVAAAGASGDDAEDSARLFQEFADKAPEEISDDIQVLADAYSDYITVLSNLGLQPGETPSADQIQKLEQAAEALNQPEVTAASDHFSSWASTNCPR